MRNIKQTKVFISAARPGQSLAETAQAHDELGVLLASSCHVSDTRHVAGCFDGQLEPAWCAWLYHGRILEGIDACVVFGNVFNQDSILVVHGDDVAELVECTSEARAVLGRFQALEGDERPNEGEDYTLVDGIYYVVR